MRYNPTERIGVNITEQIFLKDFEWIFREQTIVDVGIDALVEQSEDGEPKGKFLALQIKSGKGNFHVSKEKITYYISNTHFNYWTNFDLPVILICHILEDSNTYWQEISISKIKKADKRWKLEIPKKHLLDKKAKPYLTKLLSSKTIQSNSLKIFQGEKIEENTIFDLDAKMDCIRDASDSTEKTVTILNELTEKINQIHERIKKHNQNGDAVNSPQVNNTIKTLSKDITIASRRLENEILIYSETIAEGIYAFEQAIIIHFSITSNSITINENLDSLKILPPAIDQAIGGIMEMRTSFNVISANYHSLKLARKQILSVIDLMINEYHESKEMIESLIDKLNSKLETKNYS